jgi:hypothetical protein
MRVIVHPLPGPQPIPVIRTGTKPILVGSDGVKEVVVAAFGADVAAEESDEGVVTFTQSAEVTR